MPFNRQRTTAIASAAAAVLASAGIAGAVANQQNTNTTTNTNTTPNATQQSTQGKQGGRKGRGHRPLTDAQLGQIASKLGITADQLKAALEKTRPAGGKQGGRGPQGLADALAKELGVESSAVLTILEANKPERPTTPPTQGQRPPKPDLSKVVSALASGLNKDEATVKAAFDKVIAAHEASHGDRGNGPRGRDGRGPEKMFSALATELKLDAADVKAAFESVLGAPPAKKTK